MFPTLVILQLFFGQIFGYTLIQQLQVHYHFPWHEMHGGLDSSSSNGIIYFGAFFDDLATLLNM